MNNIKNFTVDKITTEIEKEMKDYTSRRGISKVLVALLLDKLGLRKK